MRIHIAVGSTTLTALPKEDSSVDALLVLLQERSITLITQGWKNRSIGNQLAEKRYSNQRRPWQCDSVSGKSDHHLLCESLFHVK
jgi:hypothetical protein